MKTSSMQNALILLGGAAVLYYVFTRPSATGFYNGNNMPYNPGTQYYPTVVNSSQKVDNTGVWVNAGASVINTALQEIPW